MNDLIVRSKPLIFLDYISINKINFQKLKDIVKGINRDAIFQIVLVGGETAEMPGTYSKNKFDIAGFAVNCIKNIIKKDNIKNDLVLAIFLMVYSNGYSLIRYILQEKINLKNKFLRKELIRPTKIYVNEAQNFKIKLINPAQI